MNETPAPQLISKPNAVVGVGELAISNNRNVAISTYALGSCIAVAAYDSQTRTGGIIHIMLPDSSLSPGKAERQPAMFADTGLPLMLQSLSELKVDRGNLRAFVAGGASIISGSDMFKVGERNIEAVKRAVTSLALPVIKADIGGVNNRSLQLDLETGTVSLKTVHGTSTISLA